MKAQGDGWSLTIALVEGVNLAWLDSTGHPDPYVIFTCNGKTRTSSVKLQTHNPQWNGEVILLLLLFVVDVIGIIIIVIVIATATVVVVVLVLLPLYLWMFSLLLLFNKSSYISLFLKQNLGIICLPFH